MAVQSSDNRFDWCDRLLRLKANYNDNECCNYVKNTLKTFKGADADFVAKVSSYSNDKFTVSHSYFPVYFANYTVTYTWTTKETSTEDDVRTTTTTDHKEKITDNHTYYTGVYSGLGVSKFVGRNDERYYSLSHVDDLQYHIYNDNCVYSSSQMKTAINVTASSKRRYGGDYLVNSWNCEVVFVPIAHISFTYENKVYRCYVNMHNGCTYCKYMVSRETDKLVDKAVKISRIMRILTIVTFTAGIALMVSSSVHWLLHLIGCLFYLIYPIVSTVKMFKEKNKASDYKNLYGAKGNVGCSAFKKEIGYAIKAGVMLIIGIIFFFVLG